MDKRGPGRNTHITKKTQEVQEDHLVTLTSARTPGGFEGLPRQGKRRDFVWGLPGTYGPEKHSKNKEVREVVEFTELLGDLGRRLVTRYRRSEK